MNDVILNINKIEEIDEILEVADKVFKPNKEEKEKYHQKSKWLERTKDGLLVSAKINNKTVGFAICYRKEKDLHIWNVGVLEEYRKNGIWVKMYKEIVKYAKEKGCGTLSLNTYKKQFPEMYSFAIKEKFKENMTEVDELSQDIKSVFMKLL